MVVLDEDEEEEVQGQVVVEMLALTYVGIFLIRRSILLFNFQYVYFSVIKRATGQTTVPIQSLMNAELLSFLLVTRYVHYLLRLHVSIIINCSSNSVTKKGI